MQVLCSPRQLDDISCGLHTVLAASVFRECTSGEFQIVAGRPVCSGRTPEFLFQNQFWHDHEDAEILRIVAHAGFSEVWLKGRDLSKVPARRMNLLKKRAEKAAELFKERFPKHSHERRCVQQSARLGTINALHDACLCLLYSQCDAMCECSFFWAEYDRLQRRQLHKGGPG